MAIRSGKCHPRDELCPKPLGLGRRCAPSSLVQRSAVVGQSLQNPWEIGRIGEAGVKRRGP